MTDIDLSVHSFSLWHHFAHAPGFDCIAFADLAHARGFSGLALSLNDAGYRHLGGREGWRMDRLAAHLARRHMSLEVDTSGTDPAHLRRLIEVAARMGATHLRTYTRHAGTPEVMAEATARDLAAVMPEAEAAEVTLVLENHEDFTGPELAAIVACVGHPRLRILYDYGNAQMVLEDPQAALEAVLPWVASVHIKDHVMVRPEHAGRLTVAGVPMGQGALPIHAITARLRDAGLRRFCFENVWAYAAGIRPGRAAQPGVTPGQGAFRWADPPFDPAFLVLDQRRHTGAHLVALERAALDRGLSFWRGVMADLGMRVRALR
ncbi:MAG: sugar phosphate isomerase/epimerase family protein [Gemmobacter sp.]